jgi:5'-3' exoribonuclease 2
MTDDESPILDFYPEDFKTDLNGKRHAWQGVALLPFIDEQRLLEGTSAAMDELSDEDAMLNAKGHVCIYVAEPHPVYESLCRLYARPPDSVSFGCGLLN